MLVNGRWKVLKNGLKNDIMEIDKIIWGGSGFEKCVFDFIRNEIPDGCDILEFGAGYVSTNVLMKFYNLTSVEHNPEYAAINPDTILASNETGNGWYDRSKLTMLKDKYELILIDGVNREGALNNMDIMEKARVIIIHDTDRPPLQKLGIALAEKLNKKITFYIEGDFWCCI